MSKKTDDFEIDLSNAIQKIFLCDQNQQAIPLWFKHEYGPGPYNIQKIKVMGSELGKTDIYILFQNQKELKISVKMANADYWGNWYSHSRFINEFGKEAFEKVVTDCTNWANNWLNNPNANLFIGVSVSFGKRTGNTARNLLNILNEEDIIAIIKGNFSNEKLNANATYISSVIPKNLNELFQYLKPINITEIKKSNIFNEMKIIYRPINPQTEKSNRGKCIYTKYIPNYKFDNPTILNNNSKLAKFGKFYPVNSDSLNHNRLIKELETEYNVIIPVKN